MLTYLIDGNNLIGKIPQIFRLQKKNKQTSREKLGNIISRYFYQKKTNVIIYFDGFENNKINVHGLKIYYSQKKSADDLIKEHIADSRSAKKIVLVTSDSNLAQFARKCSGKIISSEEFAASLSAKNDTNESYKQDASTDLDEFKQLFGVK